MSFYQPDFGTTEFLDPENLTLDSENTFLSIVVLELLTIIVFMLMADSGSDPDQTIDA